MSTVEFLIDINGTEFNYLKGSQHKILEENDQSYFVKQPNSPRNKNWVVEFPKTAENTLYIVKEN